MLEELRRKALFQNTVDVWVALCNENGKDWHNADGYREFMRYLISRGVKMNPFNLCVKETGGYERSREKLSLLDTLANINSADSKVYIVRLDDGTLKVIRGFFGKE